MMWTVLSLFILFANVDARLEKQYQEPISNCYFAASGSMYWGCQSCVSDLVSTTTIHMRGANNVSGHIISRNMMIGGCTEIDGDAVAFSTIKKGPEVFVHGMIRSNYISGDWTEVPAIESIPAAPSPFPYESVIFTVFGEQTEDLEADSGFALVLVRHNSHLVLPAGSIYTSTLIVKDNSTITGSEDGSTIYASSEIIIGEDVTVDGSVTLITDGNIKVGKRFCGASDANSGSSQSMMEKRRTRVGEGDEDHECPCQALGPDDFYCEEPAQVDLLAKGTVNIGTDSRLVGAIVATNIIGGARVEARCANSPFSATLGCVNIVANPGFEADLSSWSLSGGTAQVTTTDVLVGKKSYQIGGSTDSTLTQVIPTIAGKTYKWSAKFRSTGADPAADNLVQFRIGSNVLFTESNVVTAQDFDAYGEINPADITDDMTVTIVGHNVQNFWLVDQISFCLVQTD